MCKRGKMKNKLMTINSIVFMTGLSLSAVAGFYSIVGLTAIFSGAYWEIIILGTVLEISKLVSVSWLHYKWNIASKYVKAYLIFAIVILMLITSMGIFGFLSKAHLEQQLKIDTGISTELPKIELQIKEKLSQIDDLKIQLSQIDKAASGILEKGKNVRESQIAIDSANKEKAKREEIVSNINSINSDIVGLRTKKINIETEVKKIEIEVGPIKYVAELIFDSNDPKLLDKTVRIVIIVLISVIDPLAIFLLIAFNISVIDSRNDLSKMEFIDMSQYRLKKKPGRPRKKKRYLRKVIKTRATTSANN